MIHYHLQSLDIVEVWEYERKAPPTKHALFLRTLECAVWISMRKRWNKRFLPFST